MANSHILISHLECNPKYKDELKNALKNASLQSRKESYCIDHQVYENAGNPNEFVLYEVWNSKEDHSQQFEKDYIKHIIENLDKWLITPPEIKTVKEIS